MDRDGTVSEEIGYMYHTGLYKPFPWTGPAIRKINESGMKAILITNQSGVERGCRSRPLAVAGPALHQKSPARIIENSVGALIQSLPSWSHRR